MPEKEESTTGSSTARSTELGLVASVNEEIKRVVDISSAVNLLALNAMLIAKRAGEDSLGFRVVSSELRVFSAELSRLMKDLEAAVFELVRQVAHRLKERRAHENLLTTARQGEAVMALIAPTAQRLEERMHRTGQVIGQGWEGLSNYLRHALRLCRAGGLLARSAKIEAVYGGGMVGELKWISQEIETVIDGIADTVKRLNALVAG